MIVNAVLDVAGRAALPLLQARAKRNFGTAFWYTDLVDASASGRQVIRQYLVTAEALTHPEVGQWTLRDGVCEPAGSADVLLVSGFAGKWTPLGRLGVSVMPTV